MEIVELPIDSVYPAGWNPNVMDEAQKARLRRSIEWFGFLVPLVVRSVGKGLFETIGGAQRLCVMRRSRAPTVPCVVVEADDAEARLLSQVLNRVAGEDDLGLRAEIIRRILESVPEEQVLSLLPGPAEELQALAALGQESIAEHLAAWQRAQEARLRTLQIRLSEAQLEVVQEALERAEAAGLLDPHSPNRRAAAMTEICRAYLSAVRSS